jgi:formate dehydrogenase major subunit
MFIEMSMELAREKGVKQGDLVRVASKRGELTAVAMPTKRMRPLVVQGKTIHQVGIPWCFGWLTPNSGDAANLLTPNVGDPNSMTPEVKTFLVNISRLNA